MTASPAVTMPVSVRRQRVHTRRSQGGHALGQESAVWGQRVRFPRPTVFSSPGRAHLGSLITALVGAFTPQPSANPAQQGCGVLSHLQRAGEFNTPQGTAGGQGRLARNMETLKRTLRNCGTVFWRCSLFPSVPRQEAGSRTWSVLVNLQADSHLIEGRNVLTDRI